MLLAELLREDDEDPDTKKFRLRQNDVEAQIRGWSEIIHRDCKPFLSAAGNEPLFRGFKGGQYEGLATVMARTDRRPRDASPRGQKIVDDWFEEHYGVRPRQSGLFCTGDPGKARKFGQLCYVFPIGEFKYFWIRRSFGDRRPLEDSAAMTDIAQELGSDEYNYPHDELMDKFTDEMHKRYDVQTSKLGEGLRESAEIIAVSRRAYVIPRLVDGHAFDYNVITNPKSSAS